jgi:Ohr subfamily peroxiredoxin
MTQVAERITPPAAKVVYTAKTHTTGGRDNGAARSSDGRLDVRLSTPGSARIGTNPEQLFAAGWSACFESAIALVARQKKIALPGEVPIDAEVDLNLLDGSYARQHRRRDQSGLSPDLTRSIKKKERTSWP